MVYLARSPASQPQNAAHVATSSNSVQLAGALADVMQLREKALPLSARVAVYFPEELPFLLGEAAVKRSFCLFVLLTAALTGGSAMAAQLWTIPLGPTPAPSFGLVDLSADGSIAVGAKVVVGPGNKNNFVAVAWSKGEGEISLGPLPEGFTMSWATAVSANGERIVGTMRGPQATAAFLWTKAGGFQPVGSSFSEMTNALDISADGSVILGEDSNSSMLRWQEGGKVERLGQGSGIALSGDGQTIVGMLNDEPTRWNSAGQTSVYAGNWPGITGMANAVSFSGDVAAGMRETQPSSNSWRVDAVRWNRSGDIEIIGLRKIVTGMSDDGRVIVGGDNGPPGNDGSTVGYIWQEGLGSRSVYDILRHDFGMYEELLPFGYGLGAVMDVSGDGKVVTGVGSFDGKVGIGAASEGTGLFSYIVDLTDDVLPGDVNFDGKVDLYDFSVVKVGFGVGVYRDEGDANLDRRVDLTDFGIVKANFGRTVPAPVPTPEPAGIVLAGIGAIAVGSRFRRAQRRVSE